VKITSSAFDDNQPIPSKYAYKSGNLCPPLTFFDVPKNAKSLALIVHDPDVPVGDYTHWILWDLDPKTGEISCDELPIGAVQGTNDFGNTHWDGPAPPNGTHRYVFALYSMDKKLDLPSSCVRPELEAAMLGHIQASAQLTGTYSV